MENQGQLYFGLYLTSDTLLMAIVLLSAFLVLAILISMMRIYKKAGKPSISAIIPIWSQISLFQIVDKPWWYLFLLFIPIVNIVILIQAYIGLAKKFGKSAGFAVGMILLPMIFIPLLSFYDYVGSDNAAKTQEEAEPVYNPFKQTGVEQVMPEAPIAPEISETPVTTNNSLATPVIAEPVVTEGSVENLQSEGENSIPLVQETNNVINENIENTNEVVSETSFEPVNVSDEVNMVIPEIPVIETETTVVPETIQESINVTDKNNIEVPEVGQTSNENIINPTVQDIEEALKINKEPSQVAFNSTPVNFGEKEEILESLETETKVEEVMELPEIAAKVCPACGVSLAENVNFCTSCGTKV